MSYTIGGLIEATDFNNFRNQLIQVYGVGFGSAGYGQTAITVPSVSGGNVELVKSVEWTALRSAILVCSTHQGTTVSLPDADELGAGEIIQAHVPTNSGDLPESLNTITTNRLVPAASSMTLFLDQITAIRSTAWSTQIVHEFSVTFPTADEARYFFNSGGQIRVRASRTAGSSTAQNSEWTNFLLGIGSFIIDYNTVRLSSGTGAVANYGYYTLPSGAYGLLYQTTSLDNPYDENKNIQLYGMTVDGTQGANGDNGRSLRFKVVYIDSLTGSGDSVDGTFTSAVDLYRATSPLTITAPSLVNLQDLSVDIPTSPAIFSSPTAGTSFDVPLDQTEITVLAWGAGGGGGGRGGGANGARGGAGAFVQATLAVTPGETLTVRVGDAGSGGAGTGGSGNNAGAGAGGGGGGYTGLFRGSTPLLIAGAGAGGGGGDDEGGTPGVGGGGGFPTGSTGGSNGSTGPGDGGTQSAGGNGPSNATNGSSLQGGHGGDSDDAYKYPGGAGGINGGGTGGYGGSTGRSGGGAGGAGYFGGGGGGESDPGANSGAGGGGGSTYITGSNTSFSNSTSQSAPNSSSTYYITGVGNGGSGSTNSTNRNGSKGGKGLLVITWGS